MDGYQYRVIQANNPEPIAYFKHAKDAQCFMAGARQLDGARPCQLLRLEQLYLQMAGFWLEPNENVDGLPGQEVQ